MEYEEFAADLEDFWGRRTNEPTHGRETVLFGRRARIRSNEAAVLEAVDFSTRLFSRVDVLCDRSFELRIVVSPAPRPVQPVDEDLVNQLHYVGQGDWLHIGAAGWGSAHVALSRREAHLILTPELACRPDLVSSCLLNTVLLNLAIADGVGMLHASCLMRNGRALLLMAPHNTGKSTTALELVRAGFRLLTDSMVFFEFLDGNPLLMGMPVGRIKLRRDVLSRFPEFENSLKPEQVRSEIKYVAELSDRTQTEKEAVSAAAVALCLVRRGGLESTHCGPVDRAEILPAMVQNSLYFDSATVWRRNLEQLERLLEVTDCFSLELGVNAAGIVDAVNSILSD